MKLKHNVTAEATTEAAEEVTAETGTISISISDVKELQK